MGSSGVPVFVSDWAAPSRCGLHTETAGVEGPHVEDVDALHLSEDLETLETSRLLGVGGDGTGLGTLGEQVVHGLDLCVPSAIGLVLQPYPRRACSEVAAKCCARHVPSSFLRPARTLGALAEWPASFSWVASGFASPALGSMGCRWIARGGSLTAHKGGGEGAAGDGGGGRAPGGGDGRALDKHGASNWGGVERWAWAVELEGVR